VFSAWRRTEKRTCGPCGGKSQVKRRTSAQVARIVSLNDEGGGTYRHGEIAVDSSFRE